MSDPWQRARAALRPHPEAAGDPAREYDILERMRLYNVSAVSVALVHEGRLAVEEGLGTLAADDPEGVTAETLFSASSVSKAVSALAALRLVARGDLRLDADVHEHLRDWRLRDLAGRPAAGVTLRRLLTHTAGLNVHGAAGYDPSGEVPTLDAVFHGRPPSVTPAVTVVAEPGSGYRYSSGGYLVVQKLICEATGQAFGDAVEALVFGPLSMRRSTFAPAGAGGGRRAAAHVSLLRRGAAETDLAWPEAAAAGLWTTAGDLARLVLAVQEAYSGGGGFLPRELAQDALRRQTPHHDIGLGLYLSGAGAGRRFGHTGAHLGWRAEMTGWLSGGCGAAVMLNNGYTGSELKSEIIEAVTRTYGWPT